MQGKSCKEISLTLKTLFAQELVNSELYTVGKEVCRRTLSIVKSSAAMCTLCHKQFT